MAYTAPTSMENALSESERVARLDPPAGDVEIVLDTDTYNEIDDQFALVYALLADTIDVSAVYAAPFHNQNSEGPADGMEKSYDEIHRVLDLLDHPEPEELAYRGATDYMEAVGGPVDTPATDDLIRRARNRSATDPLYVVAIGAPTNVASAIERAPEILENIVVVWLGGHPLSWHSSREFNLSQDLRATRILFDSGVPLVLVPCKNVAEHVRTTVPELEARLSDRGPVGDYLLETFASYERHYEHECWSKEIWDMAPIAYLRTHEWVPTNLEHSPRISEEFRYGRDTSRHLIRVAQDVRRDHVFADFFDVLGDR